MESNDFQAQRLAMVDCQVRPSDVTKFPIIDAMLNCPREEFVPDNLRSVAYLGDHLVIHQGRVLLDPRIFAKLLNEVDIRSNEFVLDIGCGYGYSSAIISQIAEAVLALEEDQAMADAALSNLTSQDVDNAVCQRGVLCEGAPIHAPYDVIVIQGGIEILPDNICDQLKEGGRIACIFVDRLPGECRIGIKINEQISWRVVFDANAPVLDGFKAGKNFIF